MKYETEKYIIDDHRILGKYEYGYVKTYKGQAWFAFEDGWESICGVSKSRECWVLVKRPYKEKKTVEELKQELKIAKKKVEEIASQINRAEASRFDFMDL
jgi:hypothetical protein